jgi:outer membrane protein W
MLRKVIALAALSMCGLFAFASSAKAQDMLGGPTANPWELTLSGSASHGPDLDGVNAAANVSVGYYFGNFELVGRQSLQYSDVGFTASGQGSTLNASTAVALDWHFPLGDHGEWVPYIGANLGFIYGDGVHDTWEAGPEAGVKYYVNSNTFVFVNVQYEFFFDKDSDASAAFSDGQFVYGLGIGFRF